MFCLRHCSKNFLKNVCQRIVVGLWPSSAHSKAVIIRSWFTNQLFVFVNRKIITFLEVVLENYLLDYGHTVVNEKTQRRNSAKKPDVPFRTFFAIYRGMYLKIRKKMMSSEIVLQTTG